MRWRDFYRERRPKPIGPRDLVGMGDMDPTDIARLVRDWLEQEAENKYDLEPEPLRHVAQIFHEEAFYVD